MAPSKLNGDNTVSITSLAQQVTSLSEQISSYLDSESRLAASSENVPETPEYESLRSRLNDVAQDLLRLVNGPKGTLRSLIFSHYDLAALQVALDRRLFNFVPLAPPSLDSISTNGNGDCNISEKRFKSATVTEIAAKAGMDYDRTSRVLKLLATLGIFEEADGENGDSAFSHTPSSALLARDADFHATADMQMDDMLKAASELSTLISNSPYVSDTKQSAFNHRFGMPMYQYYEQNPVKRTRFAQAMSSWSQIDRQVAELCEIYPWASLADGKIVDIGGGSGHISIALARSFPSLKFVVQDISAEMLTQADSSDVSERVTFQQHDFFSPQPVHDASAFLLRQCIHNYADDEAVRILAAVVPALERCARGTPLLINDVVLPDHRSGVTRFEEHHLRQVDFCMMVGFGAKQRTEAEFASLLKRADERFFVVKVDRNPLGVGLLEAHLDI